MRARTLLCAALAAGTLFALTSTGRAAEAAGESSIVAPIAADLSATPVGDAADADTLRIILSGQARYVVSTVLPTHVSDDRLLSTDDGSPRAASSVALGLAAGLATGAFDSTVDLSAVRSSVVSAVKAVAYCHTANGGPWSHVWQSPLVSGQLGEAAWLVWGDLDEATRDAVVRVVADEADYLVDVVPVHYYRDRTGAVVTPGDSGAEEESWRSRGLASAVAMLPRDARAQRWERALVTRQAAAYATPEVAASTTNLSRSPWNSWLAGSNAEPNGDLINHGFINPNYMRPPATVGSVLLQRMARQPVSPAATADLPLLYNALLARTALDGSIIYPVAPDVRAPQAMFYADDVMVRALGISPPEALTMERTHAANVRSYQLPDGSIVDPADGGGLDSDYIAKLGEAYLSLVLGDQSSGITTRLMGPIAQAVQGRAGKPAPTVGSSLGRMFADVAGTEPAWAASWLDGHGVMRGYTDGTFRPDNPVSRIAAVISMWRGQGDLSTHHAHGFSDVPADGSEYDLAVRWAKATGVTVGTTATTFSPYSTITRGQDVLMIYRMLRRPTAPDRRFRDVAAGEVRSATNWATAAGVTLGTGPATFSPNVTINRRQHAVFVARHYAGIYN